MIAGLRSGASITIMRDGRHDGTGANLPVHGRDRFSGPTGLDEAIHILDRGWRQVAVDHGLAWLRQTEAERCHDGDDRIPCPLQSSSPHP
jgi:hypothetical protein